MIHALIIEDNVGFARSLGRVLELEGFEVDMVHELASARVHLASHEPDLVLLDQGLPDGSGLDMLDELARVPWRPVVVMVTGVDSVGSTVEAIRRGAYDYFVKPPDLDELVAVIRRSLRERELRVRLASRGHDEPAASRSRLDELLVGSSPPMREVFKAIARVAASSANVLVTGESGTGKELVARAIHETSTRREHPFVAVNCAALSSSLIESELFGHARGSFTGATRDRPGRFELAGEGTLVLDEIGELELDLQGKLLRALEERSFERVGETKSRPLQARLVCATHRDLPAEIEAGRFREDLYFRLRVVEIRLPPLRERGEDVVKIAHRLLERIGQQLDKPDIDLAPEALEVLRHYSWPGNVRELRNVIEQAAVMARDVIVAEHLLLGERHAAEPSLSAPAPVVPAARLSTLAEMERDHIQHALDQLGWVKKSVADVLGISRPTLDRKIRLYGLEPSRG